MWTLLHAASKHGLHVSVPAKPAPIQSDKARARANTNANAKAVSSSGEFSSLATDVPVCLRDALGGNGNRGCEEEDIDMGIGVDGEGGMSNGPELGYGLRSSYSRRQGNVVILENESDSQIADNYATRKRLPWQNARQDTQQDVAQVRSVKSDRPRQANSGSDQRMKVLEVVDTGMARDASTDTLHSENGASSVAGNCTPSSDNMGRPLQHFQRLQATRIVSTVSTVSAGVVTRSGRIKDTSLQGGQSVPTVSGQVYINGNTTILPASLSAEGSEEALPPKPRMSQVFYRILRYSTVQMTALVPR